MTARNKKIAIISAIVLGVLAIIVLFFIVRGCGEDEGGKTHTAKTATTDTTTSKTVSTAAETASVRTETVTVTTPPPEPDHGPYMTMAQAVAYVESSGAPGDTMAAIDPSGTWRPAATLHVIQATVSGSGSYAGDYYYFFVNGYLVGQEYFTYGSPGAHPDDSTFMVDFQVFNPGDPHCCPSGGTSSVRFRWDGSSLQTLDPMTGAVMS